MSHAKFVVHLDAYATGTVSVNGVDIPGVVRIAIEGGVAQSPLVTLSVLGEVDVEGVGNVVAAHEDASQELSDLLGAIDPDALDKIVLDGLSLGDGGSTGEAYLAALRRMIRGDE